MRHILRSLQLPKQLANHIHALSSLENALHRLHFPIQARHLTSLIPGDEFQCVRQFTAEDVEAFLKLTGDANLIHTDTAAAKAAGLPGSPILPGIMMASLFPAIIGTNFPGAMYLSQTLKFRHSAEVGSIEHRHLNHRFLFSFFRMLAVHLYSNLKFFF
jgi:MaoC like domain